MGWAAPTIYQLGDSPFASSYFHDVTCGNNGYPAGPGWDQTTGFGSEDWYQYTLGFAGVSVPAVNPPTYPWTCSNPNTFLGGNYNFSLTGSACLTATSCLAVGGGGVIVPSQDAGATWDNTAGWLEGAACPAVNTCFAVGYDGTIRMTTNGTTWTERSSGTSLDLYGIACPSTSVCYAVGDAGIVVKTSNGGTTWTVLRGGNDIALLGVACSDANTCFADGWLGTILYTSDGGATWTAQASGTADDLYAVSCPAAGTCYAVGYAVNSQTGTVTGVILQTSNGGSTWSSQTAPAAGYLYGVACPSTSTCYAAGYSYNGATSLQDSTRLMEQPPCWPRPIAGQTGASFSIRAACGSTA
jgi:photosystem II stability/assembly factor-like uncharacterized protein